MGVPIIPRIDLHRHLDGNIRIQTILDLAEKNGIRLPASDVESLRPHVTVTSPHPGLVEFLEKFRWPMAVLATPDDCRRVAQENVEDALTERLDHVELRFSPWFMAAAHRLDPAAVVEAVADGVARGAVDFGLPVKLIGILSRTFGPEMCFQELDALMAFRERLDGMPACGSPSMRVRRPGRKASGRRWTSWGRPASGTGSARSRTRPSWTNSRREASASSAA